MEKLNNNIHLYIVITYNQYIINITIIFYYPSSGFKDRNKATFDIIHENKTNSINKTNSKQKSTFFRIPLNVNDKRCIAQLKKEHNTVDFYSKSTKLASIFDWKGWELDYLSKAKVIYKFTCTNNPKICYIGRTERTLKIRIKEHLRPSSPVGLHILSCKSCSNVNVNNLFKVIDSDYNLLRLRVKETIYIDNEKPSLNNQMVNEYKDNVFTLKL